MGDKFLKQESNYDAICQPMEYCPQLMIVDARVEGVQLFNIH